MFIYNSSNSYVVSAKESHLVRDSFFEFFDSERPKIDPKSPEWRVSFKEYPRSARIFLPKLHLPQSTFADVLLKRKTWRSFSNNSLSLDILGTLLLWSVGLIHYHFRGYKQAKRIGSSENFGEEWRRPYPSGGARFPIETYVVIFNNGDGLRKGVYHYNLPEHSLESISGSSPENIKQALFYDFSKEAAALILLSFVAERSAKKYGSLGYKLGILEGGHIGQNFCLVSAALGLGICPLGGMKNYDIVSRELDLGKEETVFYQLAVGWPN